MKTPLTKKKSDEDDEEEDEESYDFFKAFGDPTKFFSNPNFIDPNKIIKSKHFKNLFKDIFEKIKHNLPPEFRNLSPQDIAKRFKNMDKSEFGFPFTYGFNINIDKDGMPTIDSFGNIKTKPYSGKPEVKQTREPMTEVNEQGDQIIVICEMPGVTRDDIELKATTHSITISTKTKSKGRNYYKEVKLLSAINSDYARARYTNGILEVTLKKIDEQQKNIKVD